MSYKTILDVDDGFGDRTPACREYTLHREAQNSRIYANIPGQTTSGPVLQVYIIRYLDISGIEIQIPSSELLEHVALERSVAKERELGSAKMEPSWSIEATHAKQLKNQTNPVYNRSEEVILFEERKWNDILAAKVLGL